MTWLRALAAAGLSMVLPGAGHALIRDWIRALLFAGIAISAMALLLPFETLADAGSVGEATDIFVGETDLVHRLLLTGIVFWAALDATFRATAGAGKGNATDAPSCPHCGRDLDEELEFCHWCTMPLESESEEEEEEPTAQ